jgi:hypothetical protein
MPKTLSELKKMLDDHYRNEARIMTEIHESKLSTEENKELENLPLTSILKQSHQNIWLL